MCKICTQCVQIGIIFWFLVHFLKDKAFGEMLTEEETVVLNRVFAYYYNEKLFKAYEELSKLDLPRLLKRIEDVNIVRILRRIEKDYMQASKLFKTMMSGSEDGWILVHKTHVYPETNSSILTYYKEVPNSPIHAVMIEGILPVSVFSLLCMFYEVDLYKTWVPHMVESRVLQAYPDQKYRFLTYHRFAMTWPFHDRDICFYGYGIDMLEERKGVLIVGYSIDNDIALQRHNEEYFPLGNNNAHLKNLPANQHDVVRISCDLGGFYVEYLSDHMTFVKIMARVDTKIPYIPPWLINGVTNHLAHKTLELLWHAAKQVEADQGEWKRRLQKDVYQNFAQRLHAASIS
jgi:hypothetical protein